LPPQKKIIPKNLVTLVLIIMSSCWDLKVRVQTMAFLVTFDPGVATIFTKNDFMPGKKASFC